MKRNEQRNAAAGAIKKQAMPAVKKPSQPHIAGPIASVFGRTHSSPPPNKKMRLNPAHNPNNFVFIFISAMGIRYSINIYS